MLDLNDPVWEKLEGGYKGSLYNASIALKALEEVTTLEEANTIYQELWDELHHQGDVGLASYYAVPYMIRIAKEKKLVDYNVLGLVTVIEIQRHKGNPPLPKDLDSDYQQAIEDLATLATMALKEQWDLSLASATLAAIALSKGQIALSNAIMNLDSEDVIDEFLESY